MLAIGIVAALVLSLLPYAIAMKSDVEQAFRPSSTANATLSSPSTANKTPGEPAFDIAAWYVSRGEEPETHGVLIETLDQSRVLASHNADIVFNPASLIKLSTSLAALEQLGADYRFQTRVLMDGRIDRDGTLQGRLYVVGNDPTFGDVGAGMISSELRARGIKKIKDGLFVSTDFVFNFSDSAEDSAARLVKALHLGEPATGVADAAPSGTPLFVFNSYPLRDILLYMNARSSNFIAERIGALIGGPEAVQRFLIEQLHLPAEQVSIERVSGREHNRMTPRGLLAVIRALIVEANRQGLQLSDIMPVASDDAGTLRRRLAGTGLEGAVVAKTGTLTHEVDGGMASLAGIVYTKDSGIIVFAIMDQGNRIWDNRQLEDQLLAEVVVTQATPQVVASPTPRQLLPSSELQIVK